MGVLNWTVKSQEANNMYPQTSSQHLTLANCYGGEGESDRKRERKREREREREREIKIPTEKAALKSQTSNSLQYKY